MQNLVGGLKTILGCAIGLILGFAAIVLANAEVTGSWVLLTYLLAFGSLVAQLPKLANGKALLPYFAFAALALTCVWNLSREKQEFEQWTFSYTIAQRVLFGLLALASVWFGARFAGEKSRPSLFWLFACLGLICMVGYFSGSIGGSGYTVRILRRLFGLSPELALFYAHYVRKTIHFTFYGIVGLCGLALADSGGLPKPRLATYGVMFALALACFDECRQIYAPGRGASAWDVMLDLSGVLAFVFLRSRIKR